MDSKDKSQSISSDSPLEHPKQDELGYAYFAKHLSDSLVKMAPSEGFVLSIHGKWGSGKSTVLNFITHHLKNIKQSGSLIVFRFNPWWFSDREDLTRLYINQLKEKLGKNKFGKVKDKLEDLSNTLSDSSSIWTKILAFLGRTYFGKSDIVSLKKEISGLLKDIGIKIIVIIDDIDRLNADEIRDLFRAIKAVGNLPNVIYLLAYDKEVVTKALESEQTISGDEYLEKIVQVPFELPKPDKISLRKLLFNKIEEVLDATASEDFDTHYWTNIYYDGIDSFFETPRDVVRYINAISVTYPVVHHEVNPVDFLAIEALRVFNSDAYDHVRNNSYLFTGIRSASSGRPNNRRKQEKERHEVFLESTPDNLKEPTKKLLKRLFPRFASCFGGSTHSSDFLPKWRKNKRICSEDIFPVYFRLSVPEGKISQKELQLLLDKTDSKEQFADMLIQYSEEHRPDGQTKLSGLLQRFDDFLEEIPLERIEPTVKAFLECGDEIIKEEDQGTGPYGMSRTDRHIWLIIRDLLKRLSRVDRTEILLEGIKESDSVYNTVNIISDLIYEHDEEERQYEIPEDERIVSSSDLDKFKKLGLKRIKDVADNDNLIDSPHLSSILYRWKDWDEIENIQEWVEEAIETDDGLLKFLYAFKSEQRVQNLGLGSGTGDVVARKVLRVDPKSIEPFIDSDKIIDRVRSLNNDNSIDETYQPIVERFIIEYEAREKGEDPSRIRN